MYWFLVLFINYVKHNSYILYEKEVSEQIKRITHDGSHRTQKKQQ